MSILYLDIETIPTQDSIVIEKLRQTITAPGNYKKPESIAAWLEQEGEYELDKLVRKTALDGLYGQILSIAWAVDDGLINFACQCDGVKESDVLTNFFNHLTCAIDDKGNRIAITKWVGHYITGFDLRFIWQRCVINGIKPPISIPYDAKPWDDRVFDTKVAWSGAGQYSGRSSLDSLCAVMFGEGKGEINGANVYDYYIADKIERIVEYNKKDVEMTRMLYKRLNFLG